MMKHFLRPAFALFSIGTVGAIATAAPPVHAQVDAVFDGTMGPAGRLNGGVVLPSQGTTNGANLFHSFSRFNVFNGATVTFDSGGANNIVTRVTGNTPSTIDGTLSADANFFFINPSGILFQDDAQLDVNGSFVATTTDGVYGNNRVNRQFNARSGNLLTFNGDPSGFLASQAIPGDIQVNGSSLSVTPGENLMLLGGNVTLRNATLTAPGGFIEIGSSAGNTSISLAPNPVFDNAPTFEFQDTTNRLNVSVSNNSLFNVAITNDAVAAGGTNVGSLRITAENITVNGSTVCGGIGIIDGVCGANQTVDAAGEKAGNLVFAATGSVDFRNSIIVNNISEDSSSDPNGNIFEAINSGDSNQFFGSIIIGAGAEGVNISNSAVSTSTDGVGSAGIVFIATEGNVSIRDSGILSEVFTGATGDAGGISVVADNLLIQDSVLTSSTDGVGDAGEINIRIESGEINSNDDQTVIRTITAKNGVGNPGNVFIQVADSLEISDNTIISSEIAGEGGIEASEQFAGGIIQALLNQNVDVTGSVVIFTGGDLTLTGGAQIRSNTFGQGNAGAVLIASQNVAIRGGSSISSGVSTDAIGSAGGILIAVDNLLIEGEATGLTTSSFGEGSAGFILVIANESVIVRGGGSGFFSLTGEESNQLSGAILIQSPAIILTNGSTINVDNQGTNSAGNVKLEFTALILNSEAQVSAVTKSGKGGNINFEGLLLILSEGSDVSTTAGNEQTGGDGGNIVVLTPGGFIYGTPFADNNITAEAFTGIGGTIQISGFPLLRDIAERGGDFSTSNDITTSSTFGIDGSVTLNALDVDPVRESEDLPQDVVDVSRLVAQGCAAGNIPDVSNIGELFITGRGGLPQNPDQVVGSGTTLTDLVTIDAQVGAASDGSGIHASAGESVTDAADHDATEPLAAIANEITLDRNAGMPAIATPVIEAQGFQVDADGTVQLVAQAGGTMPARPVFRPLTCGDS